MHRKDILTTLAILIGVAAIAYGLVRNYELGQKILGLRTQSCLDQNTRHDATLLELGKVVDVAEGHASRVALERAEAAKASTTLLINALVPKRDCSTINNPPKSRAGTTGSTGPTGPVATTP